ncbi:LysR family transcriptional regulator [Streptomyces sp. SID12501]|uniref:LysR family transcriptional regulator n=1 Tax=Streptomyces sp. SID12501 TaxID=2706042 RepID=A0A6B3BUQ4_9ACTN|nr:LysR family transcriptional regulator [Streptomyces sp. SID12501]NEC88059.1 LysR family transcriptional regulator [Streptomyces sp. SID12501]
MELRHLRHFVALAEELSFTRAASRELIVQSGLSSSVRALEREVGAKLFVRGSRPVRLTAEGLALLPAARRTLDAAAAAHQAVQGVRGLLTGSLRIGAYPVDMRLLPLPAWLADFSDAHPGLEITVRQAGGADMARMVAEGELDCSLLDPVPGIVPGLRVLPLARETLMVACPAKHPLISEGEVTLERLSREPFVETDPSWTTRMRTDSAFAAAGLHRRITCEVADWTLLINLVGAGLGVALVPPSCAHVAQAGSPDDGPVSLLPLAAEPLIREIALVLPAADASSPAARRFATYAQAKAPEHRL